jgi:signal transduction histidine kinase
MEPDGVVPTIPGERAMKITRATISTACIAAAVVGFWQWTGYDRQRDALETVLTVRGHAVLSALEGGLRSHRRMGMWLRENLTAILEETVTAPGILGLAVIDKAGTDMAQGGVVPEGLRPSRLPLWTSGGLVMFREVKFSAGPEMGPRGRGGMMRGLGWREDMTLHMSEDILDDPAWLVVHLDDSEYRASLAVAYRRFVASLFIMLAAVVLGVALVTLVQRQGRLEAELGLAQERETRLEQLSLVGAGLAHETKNPLSVIRGLAQSWADRAGTSAEVRAEANQIIDEADRVVGRVNSFLTYSRPKSPELEHVEIDKIVADTVALFEDDAAGKGVALSVHAKPHRAMADPDMVRQVLANLITNSLAACGTGSAIQIDLGTGDPGTATLIVTDTGAGMKKEDLADIVKPYFTKRPDGTGLGLAIVDQIVRAHGWRMTIRSVEDEGTAVRIEGIEETQSV